MMPGMIAISVPRPLYLRSLFISISMGNIEQALIATNVPKGWTHYYREVITKSTVSPEQCYWYLRLLCLVIVSEGGSTPLPWLMA